MHKLALAVALALGAMGAHAAQAQDMSLQSAEVSDGSTIKDEQVANVFGCKGGNISPSLSWRGAPGEAKSFAITVYDPDAPTGSASGIKWSSISRRERPRFRRIAGRHE